MKTFTRKEEIKIDQESNVSPEVSENPETTEQPEIPEKPTEPIQSTSKAESTSIGSLLGDVPDVTKPDSDVGETLEAPPMINEDGEVESGPVDVDGRTFDPDLHLVNEDGSPRISEKTKKLMKKRGRRKASDSNGYLDGDVSTPEAKAVAETYFQGFKMLGSVMLGEEFAQHTAPEGQMVTKAIEAVCIESNSTGLTPKQMLGVALMSYTAPRVTTPTAKERMGLIWFRIKKLFKRKNPEEAIVEEEV